MESKTGEVVDVKEKNQEDIIKPTKTNQPSSKNGLIIALSILALLFGCGGLVLGWLGYEKSSTPITFLNGGADGNSANFVEGSIADIADKVSKSVVSIVTSTKITNYFGQSYDSAAAGTCTLKFGVSFIVSNSNVVGVM